MPEFTCTVCGTTFTVPQKALEKYPDWKPGYCRKHSPRKSPKAKTSPSRSVELDLGLEEVLLRFSEGPDSGVFTDGAARPNPGPGGWGVVYVEEGEIIEQRYGQAAHTTNNRMELTALIEAYKLLPADLSVTIYSDSNLCVKTLNEWAPKWEKRGWERKSGPIKNLELVQELHKLHQHHHGVAVEWIKAHNGWLWNEYADSLATAWARDEL